MKYLVVTRIVGGGTPAANEYCNWWRAPAEGNGVLYLHDDDVCLVDGARLAQNTDMFIEALLDEDTRILVHRGGRHPLHVRPNDILVAFNASTAKEYMRVTQALDLARTAERLCFYSSLEFFGMDAVARGAAANPGGVTPTMLQDVWRSASDAQFGNAAWLRELCAWYVALACGRNIAVEQIALPQRVLNGVTMPRDFRNENYARIAKWYKGASADAAGTARAKMRKGPCETGDVPAVALLPADWLQDHKITRPLRGVLNCKFEAAETLLFQPPAGDSVTSECLLSFPWPNALKRLVVLDATMELGIVDRLRGHGRELLRLYPDGVLLLESLQ